MSPLRLILTTLAALSLPLAAQAVGSDSTTPPAPTPTAECPAGQVWNPGPRRCEMGEASRHGDAMLYEAVRELAHVGRYESAALVLAQMSNPKDDRVLTYRGFLARMQGDTAGADHWYRAAIRANPDNLLVRSYLGQGLVAAGNRYGAQAQLFEIRARGGHGTWAEVALARALRTGVLSSY